MLIAKKVIKDHWSDWDEKFISAPEFDVNLYQEKLNTVCGKSRGEPIMKLIWGGDATITKYTGWNSSGEPIKADIIPRFAIPRTHPIFGHKMYIPVRRWIICERSEPEQRLPDDNSDNKFTDENGITCEVADKTQHAHEYLPYIYVGDHSKCPPDCCSERLCLGDYKHPDNAEIDYLIECTYKLRKDFFCDPYSPVNKAQVARILKEYNDEQEKRREAEEIDLEAENKEWLKTHGHNLADYNFKQPIYIFKKGKPL